MNLFCIISYDRSHGNQICIYKYSGKRVWYLWCCHNIWYYHVEHPSKSYVCDLTLTVWIAHLQSTGTQIYKGILTHARCHLSLFALLHLLLIGLIVIVVEDVHAIPQGLLMARDQDGFWPYWTSILIFWDTRDFCWHTPIVNVCWNCFRPSNCCCNRWTT